MFGSICWYCYWGWPKVVADIFKDAKEKLDGDSHWLEFGPGHIVWSDENWDSARWCLDHFDEYSDGMTPEQCAIVRESLERLEALPLEAREVEPDNYDDQHPENFPPPDGVEMVKVRY